MQFSSDYIDRTETTTCRIIDERHSYDSHTHTLVPLGLGKDRGTIGSASVCALYLTTNLKHGTTQAFYCIYSIWLKQLTAASAGRSNKHLNKNKKVIKGVTMNTLFYQKDII